MRWSLALPHSTDRSRAAPRAPLLHWALRLCPAIFLLASRCKKKLPPIARIRPSGQGQGTSVQPHHTTTPSPRWNGDALQGQPGRHVRGGGLVGGGYVVAGAPSGPAVRRPALSLHSCTASAILHATKSAVRATCMQGHRARHVRREPADTRFILETLNTNDPAPPRMHAYHSQRSRPAVKMPANVELVGDVLGCG